MQKKSTRGYLDMELLRFSTAGSVDDGKSTLIGRLLYDSKSIFEDQMEAVTEASKSRGNSEVNLALLTDGLRAEREQGITIDVAYRYFATPKRKFIIADTPGHVQYTRNMVTGASTSDLSIILVDARHGVLEQTIRHSYISSLLGIPQIVVAINKMDLVNFSQDVFNKIVNDYNQMSAILNIKNVVFIPICAKAGDNVVEKSENMKWYHGESLLEYLENVEINTEEDAKAFRFPVQYVIRPIDNKYHDFRGYAGRIASGTIHVGDKIKVFPSEIESEITELYIADKALDKSSSPSSITMCLKDDVDISRGNLIVKTDETMPMISGDIKMTVCWFNEQPLKVRNKYLIRQITSSALGLVKNINFVRNINTLEKDGNVEQVVMNDIAEITVHTATPLVFDNYADNRITGSVIFIDPFTNETVGAGMINQQKND